MTESFTLWVARTVQALATEARRRGLTVPAYRVSGTSPTLRRDPHPRVTIPRHPGVDPDVERRLATTKLIEGTLLVNGLHPGTASWQTHWAELVAATTDRPKETTP